MKKFDANGINYYMTLVFIFLLSKKVISSIISCVNVCKIFKS